MPKAATAKSTDTTTVRVLPLDIKLMEVTIVGDSPLLSHAWSDRVKKAMLAKQMGEGNTGREKKDPDLLYEESIYYLSNNGHKTYGFPSVAFKAAAVGACRFVDGIKMTEARGAFHIVGDMVELQGEPRSREDMVRLESGVADIRYRAEFPKWKTTLRIRYNAKALTAEQIINLLNVGGFGVGVGNWRPEKNGSFGMFHVATSAETEQGQQPTPVAA